MDISKRLTELDSSNLHILEADEQTFNKFMEEVRSKLPKDTFLAIIDGNRIDNLCELFEAFVEAFKFPDYFGKNWAAFDECINDLDWLNVSSYILVLKDIDIKFNDEQNINTLLRILCNSANEWSMGRNYDSYPTPPTPFHIIFVVPVGNGSKIDQRLKAEGFRNIEHLSLSL